MGTNWEAVQPLGLCVQLYHHVTPSLARSPQAELATPLNGCWPPSLPTTPASEPGRALSAPPPAASGIVSDGPSGPFEEASRSGPDPSRFSLLEDPPLSVWVVGTEARSVGGLAVPHAQQRATPLASKIAVAGRMRISFHATVLPQRRALHE